MQTNYQIIVDICKQTLITSTNFTIRMNIKFGRIFQFFSQFNFDVRYKSRKNHIISNALSKLVSTNHIVLKRNYSKLNILFVYNAIFIEMFSNFHEKTIDKYFKDFAWRTIQEIILINEILNQKCDEFSFSIILFSFEIDSYMKLKSEKNHNQTQSFSMNEHKQNSVDDELIYYTNNLIELRRLCISNNCTQNVFKIAHDENHSEFIKCFEIVFKVWYIKNFIKQLRIYI